MNGECRVLPALVGLIFVVLLGTLPAHAQDDAPASEDESARGKIFVELGVWIAQPQGLEYRPAFINDPTNTLGPQMLELPHGTTTEGRYRAGYDFGKELGSLLVTWYSHTGDSTLEASSAGDFIYGELLAHPLFAGYQNDGLADGYQAASQTKLRDFRIDWYRTAFKSRRIAGKWFVGLRRVAHQRNLFAEYYAQLPGLPPLIPPVATPNPGLNPFPDQVQMQSAFEGRGLEAGIDVAMPIVQDKLELEAGLALAILRGEIDTVYSSTTHFYTITEPVVGERFLFPDEYEDAFENTPDLIAQQDFEIGLLAQQLSTTATVLEVYLGLRYWALPWFSAFLDFRMAQYDNVGMDLRPVNSEDFFGFNLVDARQTNRSAVYEGFAVGVAFRF